MLASTTTRDLVTWTCAVCSAVWLGLLAPSGALVGQVAVKISDHDYDSVNAAEIMELCAGCHGEFGQGGGSGEYPRLAGLPAKYLVDQMQAFKDHTRENMAMAPYATDREMPAEDMFDISIFLSRLELPAQLPVIDPSLDSLEKLLIARRVFNVPRLEGDLGRGRQVYGELCKRCHGIDGAGRGRIPALAGQYSEYLKRQMELFQTGERPSGRMQKSAINVSDDDLAAILAFLSVADD